MRRTARTRDAFSSISVLSFALLFSSVAPLGCDDGGGGAGGGAGGGSGSGGGSGGGGAPDAGNPDPDECAVCVPIDDCHTAACITGECVQTLIDFDGDGFAATMPTCGSDCDDADDSVFPGADEIVGDEIDQSCDGDEICYFDADEDGYRGGGTVASVGDLLCSKEDGEARMEAGPDCNDQNPAINPGLNEIPGDNQDRNCDGMELCYVDVDMDAQRSNVTVVSADADCLDVGERQASNDVDCCDFDDRVFVGQTQFFPTSAGASACGGWDFDCDGNPERRYDVTHLCTPGTGTTQCAFNRGGWLAAAPACGGSSTFVTACSGFGTCSKTTTPREQECR